MHVALMEPNARFRGARFDLDFVNGRYTGGVVSGTCISPSGTIGSLVQGPSNGTVAYTTDFNGNMISYPQYAVRVVPGLGLLAEANVTNYLLYNRDLTQAAWTPTTMTVAKTQIGNDLTNNGACLLTSTAANATIAQTSATFASRSVVSHARIKRSVGTGTVQISQDAGATYTDVTSQVVSGKFTLCATAVQTLTQIGFIIKLGTSGDAIVTDFIQGEGPSTAPTSVMVNTTTATQRGIDEPSISDPSGSRPGDGLRIIQQILTSGRPFSMVQWGSGDGTAGQNSGLYSDGGLTVAGVAPNSGASSVGYFQSNSRNSGNTTNTGNVGRGNLNKIAGRASGVGTFCCLNGGPIVQSAAGTGLTAIGAAFTHIGVGNNGSAVNILNGYTARLAFFDREITDQEMIAYTS